jgi:uncharacterized repeat protein (TIGR01451 family)
MKALLLLSKDGRWRRASLGAAVLVAAVVPAMAFSAPGDQADLKLTKSDSPDPVTEGSHLTYTIEVQNLGPAAATNVVVTDNLPGTVDFVSASNGCSRKGRKVTCSVGGLSGNGGGARRSLTITVTPNKAGTISNSASVDGSETDPQRNNNSDTEETVVNAKPSPPPGPLTCRGVPATVRGTPGSDDLVGTGGPDVVAALGGNDEIATFAGNDLVCAGRGNDSVGVGSAADRVFGGDGADLVLGRGGADLLRGNDGNDNLKGNRGNDRLRGGRGSDRCRGGPGSDSLRSCER